MVYVVTRFYEEIVGVFDSCPAALDYAKELNAEEGFFLEEFNSEVAYAVEGYELNNPDGIKETFEPEDVLLPEEDYERLDIN